MAFENIPQELRQYPQWILWKYEETQEKRQTKVPYSANTDQLASVSDPATWSNYDHALRKLRAHNSQFSGLGFVLTENDPFTFIDLDDTQGNADALAKQVQVFNEFFSYAERSPSGKGLHIIVKGKVFSGRRRSCIEVYSSARYMTMTGDVFRAAPINDHNELLQILWAQMAKGTNIDSFYAGLEQEKMSDQELLDTASKATNGQKFQDLFQGNWQIYYQSQSEADFALINIISFYSQNRLQIIRLFHQSVLGQRDKAKRSDYLNWMLNKSFDRMLPPVDLDGFQNKLAEAMAEKNKKLEAFRAPIERKIDTIYSFPPGLIGEIAQFIFDQAPQPIPEIALAGAIGLMAGIVGRSYNISGNGLNQYTLLLAGTGVGKEAMYRGIDRLMNKVCETVPSAREFIGPAEIASHQAVIKYMSNSSLSFISFSGEIGHWFKRIKNVKDTAMEGFMRFLLLIYSKSGQGEVYHNMIYSDKDKNTKALEAPNFSLLCETTPEKFYSALTEDLILDGFLPRITTIEYQGEVPKFQKNAEKAVLSPQLVERLASLCAQSKALNSQNIAVKIEFGPGAEVLSDQIQEYQRNQVNASDKDVYRNFWTRTHMKTLKLAALVAVGCNPYTPQVTVEMLNWAKAIVMSDCANMLSRFKEGKVGEKNEETDQIDLILKSIKRYLTLPANKLGSYVSKDFAHIHAQKVVTHTYLSRALISQAPFKKDKIGATNSLKKAIKTLIERGDLVEMSKPEVKRHFNVTCICYAVVNPETFGI